MINSAPSVRAPHLAILICWFLAVPRVSLSAPVEDALPPPQAPPTSMVADTSGLEAAVAEQFEKAIQELNALEGQPDIDPKTLATRYGALGRLYLAYGRPSAAEPMFRHSMALDPEDYRYPYHLGYAQEQAGEIEAAVGTYADLLRTHPDLVPLRYRLARLYRMLGRLDEADRCLARGISLWVEAQEGLAALFAERGELRAAQGRNVEAIADLGLALSVQPDASRLEYPLGLAYRAVGDSDSAREHIARRGAIGITIPDPMFDGIPALAKGEIAHLLRGLTAYRAGDVGAALNAFGRAAEEAPESATAQVDLGVARAHSGDREGAKAAFQRAIELGAESATAWYNLGILLAEDGDHAAAVEMLRTAVEKAPTDPESQWALGRSLTALKRFDEAKEALSASVRIDPKRGDAWLKGIAILLGEGDYPRALEVTEAAFKANPQDPRITLQLARLLAGSPRLAQRDPQRALALVRSILSPEITLEQAKTLAWAYAAADRCAEAAVTQQKIVEFIKADPRGGDRTAEEARLIRYAEGPPCAEPSE